MMILVVCRIPWRETKSFLGMYTAPLQTILARTLRNGAEQRQQAIVANNWHYSVARPVVGGAFSADAGYRA